MTFHPINPCGNEIGQYSEAWTMHTDWSESWMESGPMGGGEEGRGRLDCNLSGPGTHWQGPLDHLSNMLKSFKVCQPGTWGYY